MAGNDEADALMLIANAIRDTNLGLKTIGEDSDGGFSIVVVEEDTGLVVVFAHPQPSTVIDRFIEFCDTVKAVPLGDEV